MGGLLCFPGLDTATQKKRFFPQTALRFALYVGGPAAATLLGFLGSWYWIFDLFSHFRVQYALILFVAALALLARRHRGEAAAAALFALVNGALLLPLYLSHPAPPLSGATPLRIATFNAFAANKEREKAWDFLRRESPDLLLIVEMQKGWAGDLLDLAPQYQTLASEPRDGTLGLALLSKIPVKDVQLLHVERGLEAFSLGSGLLLAVQARFEWDGRETTFLGIHPAPPVAERHARARDVELAAVAKWTRAQGTRPLIVAGDFNSSPWGHHFRKLVADTGLVNSQRGFGLQASWCEGCGLLSLFKIPIDHVLHSRQWTTVERRLAPPLGSDHRMVLATLEWAEAK